MYGYTMKYVKDQIPRVFDSPDNNEWCFVIRSINLWNSVKSFYDAKNIANLFATVATAAAAAFTLKWFSRFESE